MAFSPLAIGALGVLGSDVLSAIWSTSPQRVIMWAAEDSAGNQILDATGQPVTNSIYPQVVVEERHFDRMRITRNPVEMGAAVTDHAYKEPAQVVIRGGWSYAAESPTIALPVPTDISYLGSIYSTLLAIQAQRQFVSLVTGKRTYPTVMLETLSVQTDEKTENVLAFTAEFSQILIARTQVVSVPPVSVMKSPQTTGATTDQGNTSLLSAPTINKAAANSALPSDLSLY